MVMGDVVGVPYYGNYVPQYRVARNLMSRNIVSDPRCGPHGAGDLRFGARTLCQA